MPEYCLICSFRLSTAFNNSLKLSDANSTSTALPAEKSDEEIKIMIEGILSDWKVLCDHKGITRTINTEYKNGKIFLYQSNFETIYNIEERTISGYTSDVSEDLRDYLRRRGIKIYTDRFFKSI